MSSPTLFVNLVREYPCIYASDWSRVGKNENEADPEEAWQYIAQDLGWTVTTCKNLWATIVKDFTSYIIEPSIDGMPKKPYYLLEELDFFMPYIPIPVKYDTRRESSPNRENTKNSREAPEYTHVKQESEKYETAHESESEDSSEDVRRRPGKPVKRLQKTPKNGGKLFLLSLLPDVEKLSDRQLDTFRLKVLTLMGEIKGTRGQ